MRLGIIGDPVAHSLSPKMHQAAMRQLGISGEYLLLPTPAADLARRLEEVRTGFNGVNVTVPHKRVVLPLLDEVEDRARAIGAVNTIVNRGGVLLGYNTDAPGFYRALEKAGFLTGEALVLGAGGAARAIVYELVSHGWLVGVANRTFAKAEQLAAELGAWVVAPDKISKAVSKTPLLINATSAGLQDPDQTPLPDGALPADGAVVDIVYGSRRTRLLRQADAAGLSTMDGLEMLLQQGALAFELWSGGPAPLAVMRRALEEA